eukprot:TRINITY_DN12501_c0_g1_i1.p1 TRINITY_DN12501_c0_g1~~TRINITY_DN12501_c0_g1_i1.p1  ORF type:complete len:277 (-),score=53.82 TRINITY_DN12501_c0_g1_i1:32-862(-)
MGKHAQLVMGPAGSGKSTYCKIMHTHCETLGRTVHCVNLDPAAEVFNYPVSIDIKELVSIEAVTEELGFGPNGGLVYCMEHLLQNLDWLEEQVGEFEDDYLIIDCPGQIELFTHYPIIKTISTALSRWGYTTCAVYLVDSHFMNDAAKFISGTLMCLSVMYQLELPHVNVLTKMDLWGQKKKQELERFLDPDMHSLVEELNEQTEPRFAGLNAALGSLIEDDSLVGFIPLNVNDEESIRQVLGTIDHAIQYGEDLEPKEPKDYLSDDEPEWDEGDM